MAAYVRYINSCRYIKIPEAYAQIVLMPSARFWVSGTRAAVVVSNIIKGATLEGMRPSKREMFKEIYRRYLTLKEQRPEEPLARLVDDVVNQPAPKFYLSAGSARAIILKAKKQWHSEKMRRLKRHSLAAGL